MATQRLASASHSNIGKSTTHSGCQPPAVSFRSCPIFRRSAPSASLTTLAESAPKKMRSLSAACVRSRMPLSAASLRNLMMGDCSPSRPRARSLTLMYASPLAP